MPWIKDIHGIHTKRIFNYIMSQQVVEIEMDELFICSPLEDSVGSG